MFNQKDIDRFWSYVNKHSGVFAIVKSKKSECWMWTNYLDSDGYGEFKAKHKHYKAHVASYMISKGLKKKPKKLTCHHCDNPPCIRASHLWKGTPKQNSEDMVYKGRQAKGEKHGSRTHPENIPRGDRNGARTHPESRSKGLKHSRIMKKVAARGDKHRARLHPETVARGEAHGMSRLTEKQAKNILLAYSKKAATQVELARKYKVNHGVIHFLVSRRTWKHLGNYAR